MKLFPGKRLTGIGLSFFITCFSAITSTSVFASNVAQSPLLLGGGGVPGNLALVPSVEYPTVISVANTGSYKPSSRYVGYFNSAKCYQYDKSKEYFHITGNASNHVCNGVKDWSGNFLNWAATPTIDPFRSALTGGYRVVDTRTETVLQKARHGNEASFGNRLDSDQGLIEKADIPGATPASSSWDNFYIRLQGIGSDMYFSNWKDGIGGGGSSGEKTGEWTDFNHATTAQWDNNGRLKTAFGTGQGLRSVYKLKVRVRVCDASKGLEENCELYPSGYYKPVGLLQQYAEMLRYSVFGYLNDSDMLRDGGVLRAQQKYIGPALAETNRHEWEPETGVFIPNPDGINSALGRSISNSGVINYVNKFGELNNRSHKSHDPVSELFYASLRYFKDQGNVSAYSTATPAHNSNPGNSELDRWHDGFPVITSWNDPIQYACQRNVILGIGDVNTHRDKNLPGSTASKDEPSKPSEVSSDTSINVVTATNKVAALEGIAISNTNFSGRENSAFIAGLAYDANTKDLRDDFAGKQTVSTYWVDVQEGQVLQSKEKNQYWLAAKYGGFKVPDDFGNPYTRTQALPDDWWWTSGDRLPNGEKRPDNFFLASDATKMVEGLKQAFAQIANEVQSSTASLAANSSRLELDTAVYQSRLNSRFWSGDLLAFEVEDDGSVGATPAWSAAGKLDALVGVDGRNILTIRPAASGSVSTSGTSFTWVGLSTEQQGLLKKAAEGNNDLAQKRLNYLRGDRSEEISADNRTRPFRQRDSRMGDIVNSDPQYVYQQDFGYSRLTGWTGGVATKYREFRSTDAYKARVPMVLVGSNDGMLHAFDARLSASGGDELFAFIPNGIFHNLMDLTDPSYTHKYYVDGTPRVSDAWLGSRWATIAVGSAGAGGKSIFALDVTDIAGKSTMNSTRVMWEFTDDDMGYTIGQPAIVALPNKQFGVVVTSGAHDVAPDQGYVWILDINNGSVIKEFEIPTTGDLGSPLVVDLDFNQEADRIYVADTLGNVWRLDLESASTSQWGIPTSLAAGPLFVAKDSAGQRQAITAPLSSAYNQAGVHTILFGTGSFYRVGDNEIPENPPVETFYGIFDSGSLIDGRDDLLQQKIIEEAVVSGKRVRAVSAETLNGNHEGWYLDLAWFEDDGGGGPTGERVVAKANLRSDRVLFTTMTPTDDPCAFGGTSMIMALDLSSGSRLLHTYFDVDGDGELNENDDWRPDEDGDTTIPWSGISVPEDGVVKGLSTLHKWICYAGSSGALPKCVPVAGSMREGRQSWREVRESDE